MKRLFFLLLVSQFSWLACYPQQWIKADEIRKRMMLGSNYDSALYYAEEAAAIMRGTIGENNSQYGIMLRNLAYPHFYLGNYKKAEYFILKEAELWERLKKTNSSEYINCLRAAAIICRKAGEYDLALSQIKKADKKALDIYKSDSREYAAILTNYAGVYHDMGCAKNDMIFLNQEDKYLKRAEAIYAKYGDETKFERLNNISDQAVWNNNVGNLPEAENKLKQVAEFCKKELGTESKGYAAALNNLAVLYYNSGDYKLAENNFIEALSVMKKIGAGDRPEMAIPVNNLSALYYEIGNFPNAVKLLTEARVIMERNHQKANPTYSVILNNIATVNISDEYYAIAGKKNKDKLSDCGRLIFMADSIFRINCQKPHPAELTIEYNIAIWQSISGDRIKSIQTYYKLAEESNLSLRVVAMMNKMSISEKLPDSSGDRPGPDFVLIPINNNLFNEVNASNTKESGSSNEQGALVTGLLRMVLGKAENVKKAVGPYHPAYGEILKALNISYASFDDFKTEEELTLEYMNVINHRMLQDFSNLSESEKEMYFQTRLPDAEKFASYSLMRKVTNPLITRYTYNNILLNKGLMLKSSTAMRLAILNSNNADLLKQYDKWIALQKEISVLYSTPVEMRDKDLAELESTANTLERSLVASSQDFSIYRKGLQVTWEDVKKSLKSDEAAVEFTDFRRREKDGGNELTYCALVLRPDSEAPEMIKLFTEDQLRAVIEKGGGNTYENVNQIYGNRNKRDSSLYNLVWRPIEKYLQGATKIFVSPSGLLNKISFPAISNNKGVYLCDSYQIQIKGSTGNITGQTLFAQGKTPSAMVFGGIQYSEAQTGSEVWSYLTGTKEEGDVVNSILRNGKVDVSYLSGVNATETFFKEKAGNYNILHLATHGFFFDDPNKLRFNEKKESVEFGEITFRGSGGAYGVNSFVNNENPLMRSGLVLAGANDVWVKQENGDKDDGVLTAQEVTQMDLRKNDLVVLSACETGLGDIKGTEGVYGLQRSLKMAGAKYIVMSLWQIPDKETVEFMGMFYSNLLTTKDIKAAFNAAQRTMREKYDPYFWGAFVLME